MAEYVGKISKQKRSSKSRSRKIKRSNRITAKEIDDFIINEMKTKKGKYTGEEEFLLKYFNIQSTNIPRRKLRLSKFSKEKYHKYKITDDELQIHRYKALIDFLKLYIEIKDKMHRIMDRNLNIQRLLGESLLEDGLSAGECKDLSQVIVLYHNLQDILEREIYFKGGMDSYYYFKKIGVID